MNSVISKNTTVTFCKTFLPVIRTQLINNFLLNHSVRVVAAYRHTKSKKNNSTREHRAPVVGSVLTPNLLRKLQFQKGHSLWKSILAKTSPKHQRNGKIPKLVYLKNIIKAQPKHMWRAIWESSKKNKPIEWPVFNRGVQYENTLKNLTKTRLKTGLTQCLLNEAELKEIQDQLYLPHRVKNLGPDLAAVHFFTDRRAAVKLLNQEEWIVGGAPRFTSNDRLKKCITGSYLDEECYVSGCHIEALDCSHFIRNGIRFEGLKYLAGLKFLLWLSLKNQKYINVWCLDRIAGYNGKTLEYLDISKCDLDLGCIVALARMRALQTLIIKQPGEELDKVKNALSDLKRANKKLSIRSINTDFE